MSHVQLPTVDKTLLAQYLDKENNKKSKVLLQGPY